MRLLLHIQTVILALCTSHALAAPTSAPADASSSIDTQNDTAAAPPSAIVAFSFRHGQKLPGANLCPVPVPGAMLADANANTTARAVVTQHVPADAVFGQRCRHLSLLGDGKKGRSTLQAACLDDGPAAKGNGKKDGEGTWWLTSLNLNQCLGNDGGSLVFAPQGNYDSTCRPCGLSSVPKEDRVTLRCSCLPKPDGVAKFTELSLGEYYGDLDIKAVNGRLVCGSHRGTKSPHFNATSGNGGEV